MEDCGLQPAPNGGWQNLSFPGNGMDAKVVGQPCGNHRLIAVDTVVNLEACGVQLLAAQVNEKGVTVAHGSMVTGLAVNDGQCRLGIGENLLCSHAKLVQGVFIGLMTPAQQVMKMHDACRIGFPKTNGTTDNEPGGPWERIFCRHWI